MDNDSAINCGGIFREPAFIQSAISEDTNEYCYTSVIAESRLPERVNHSDMSNLAMAHVSMTYAGRLRIIIKRPFN